MIQPAERCCGGCPLLQGVQIIASYSVVMGSFSLLSLLRKEPADGSGESQSLVIVSSMQMLLRTFALFAGLKGLIGICTKTAQPLRVLLFYHVADLALSSVAIILQELDACHELAEVQRMHELAEAQHMHTSKHPPKITCDQARLVLAMGYCIHSFMTGYFAYVIWSLIVRLEADDFLFESELAERGGLGGPWANDPFVLFGQGSPGDPHNLNGPLFHRVPPNAPFGGPAFMGGGGRGAWASAAAAGGDSGTAPPRPFAGEPRNLADQGSGRGHGSGGNSNSRGGRGDSQPEPFQGTAHRLE